MSDQMAEGEVLTHSGARIDPLNPDPDDIVLEDIAHGLARTARFSGQIPFLSVAIHSLNVAARVEGAKTQLAALMHDAAEAYLGDLASPVKARLRGYREAEEVLRQTIFHEIIGTSLVPGEVTVADREVAILEARWGYDDPHVEDDWRGVPDVAADDSLTYRPEQFRRVDPEIVADYFAHAVRERLEYREALERR